MSVESGLLCGWVEIVGRARRYVSLGYVGRSSVGGRPRTCVAECHNRKNYFVSFEDILVYDIL